MSSCEIFANLVQASGLTVIEDAKIQSPALYDHSTQTIYLGELHESQLHLKHGLNIHEIGHAAHSEMDKIVEFIDRYAPVKSLFNIIDDGYQERRTCAQFPGAKKHLQDVFEELIHSDIQLIIEQQNPLTKLINTLNYNCKGKKFGYYIDYDDVDTELLSLLHECENVIGDFEVRLELCERLNAKIKQQQESKTDGESDDTSDELGNQDNSDEGELNPSPSGEGDDEDSEEDESENDVEEDDEDGEFDLEEFIQDNFDEIVDHHSKIMLADSDVTWNLLSFSELFKTNRILDILQPFGDSKVNLLSMDIKAQSNVLKRFGDHFREANKAANSMYSRFISKVQTRNIAMSTQRKSGKVDPKRLYDAMTSDSIFRQMQIEPNQPDHAFVLMLDWSGSMHDKVMPMINRIMEIVQFANASDVRIDIWLNCALHPYMLRSKKCFSMLEEFHQQNKFKSYLLTPGKFIHVLDTKRHGLSEQRKRLSSLFILGNFLRDNASLTKRNWKREFTKDHQQMINEFSMGFTNIQESIVFAEGVLDSIKADRKKIFILSDGSDNYNYDFSITTDGKISKINWDFRRKNVHSFIDNSKVMFNGTYLDTTGRKFRSDATVRAHLNRNLIQLIKYDVFGIAWGTVANVFDDSVKEVIMMKAADSSQNKKDFWKADNKIIEKLIDILV